MRTFILHHGTLGTMTFTRTSKITVSDGEIQYWYRTDMNGRGRLVRFIYK